MVLEGKTGKEIPESSRLEFLEKFLVNSSVLSDAEDNTSGLLNGGGIADLPLTDIMLIMQHLLSKLKIQKTVISEVNQIIKKKK